MYIIDDISKAVRAIAEAIKARYDYKKLSMQETQDDGKRDSELATQLLTSIYRYRDAMSGFMNPYMSVPLEEAPDLSEAQKFFRGWLKIENERYDNVVSARQKLYDSILTSEALWGDDIRSVIEKMHEIETIVRTRIVHKLTTGNPDANEGDKKIARQHLEIMMEDPKNKQVALTKRFDELVKEAEDYLKPKT